MVIPEIEIVQPDTQKLMDEVILDVRDLARSRGHQRFVVGAHYHGHVLQIYTGGLPSREQVAKTKCSWKETAAKLEHTR